MDAAAKILATAQPQARIALASFIASFPVLTYRSEEPAVVVETAFVLKSRFGIDILSENSNLVPQRGSQRRYSIQKIIDSFSHFDGPSQWKALSDTPRTIRDTSIAKRIAASSDIKIMEAAEVLSALNMQRIKTLDFLPLISIGTFLDEFLGPEQSLNARKVRDFALSGVEESIIARPFLRMAQRTNEIRSTCRGRIPVGVFDSLLRWPSDMFFCELRAQSQNEDRVSLIENAVLHLYDFIEALSLQRETSPMPDLSWSIVSVGKLQTILYWGSAPGIEPKTAVDAFIAKLSAASDSIRSGRFVASDMLDLPL